MQATRSMQVVSDLTNNCFYRSQVFYSIIDVILGELNHRFDSNVTELLSCVSAFDSREKFNLFDIENLLNWHIFMHQILVKKIKLVCETS